MSFDPNRPVTPGPITPTPAEPFGVPTGPMTASPPVMAPTAKRKGSGGGWLNVVLAIAVAVAIGGVAFAIGRSTAPASAVVAGGRGDFGNGIVIPGGNFGPRASGQPGFGRGGFGGGLTISGTVESVNGDTLTIKTASGQTVEVKTGAETKYNTQTAASASDVQTGKKVQVQLDFSGGGRPNTDPAADGPLGTAGSVTVVP